jgi:hypothetical protein
VKSRSVHPTGETKLQSLLLTLESMVNGMTKARAKKPESAAISRHWRLWAAGLAGLFGWLAARH